MSAKILSSHEQDYLPHLKTPLRLGDLQNIQTGRVGDVLPELVLAGKRESVHPYYILSNNPKVKVTWIVTWISFLQLKKSHQHSFLYPHVSVPPLVSKLYWLTETKLTLTDLPELFLLLC